jgi:cytochrome d ubiquinol oxidase subunit I
VGAAQVSASLLAFMVVYAVIFTVGALYILRLMAEGPVPASRRPPQPDRAPGSPLGAADMDGDGEPA